MHWPLMVVPERGSKRAGGDASILVRLPWAPEGILALVIEEKRMGLTGCFQSVLPSVGKVRPRTTSTSASYIRVQLWPTEVEIADRRGRIIYPIRCYRLDSFYSLAVNCLFGSCVDTPPSLPRAKRSDFVCCRPASMYRNRD
jgi:hypothetical protein